MHTKAVAATAILLPLLCSTRLTANGRAARCLKISHERNVLKLSDDLLHRKTASTTSHFASVALAVHLADEQPSTQPAKDGLPVTRCGRNAHTRL